MSSNDVIVSGGEQDEAEADSVFDFLYHDSRRIGSFLSQFDNNGLLTGLTQAESAARNSKRGWKVGVGGELPLLAGAKVEVERQPGESGSESMERSYDPFWTNAVAFLDLLQERRLIKPQIEQAALGQFVLARGRLTILDMTLFKDAWALDTVQRAVRSGEQPTQPLHPHGNRQARRAQGQQHSRPIQMPTDNEIAVELMQVLPHTVNASITTDTGEVVWSIVRGEFMVTPSSDLVLTHGMGLPGEWAMLGILSARPDYGEIGLQQQLAQLGASLPPGITSSGMGIMMQVMTPLIRTVMGRPEGAYGVTPLLIFREVTGA